MSTSEEQADFLKTNSAGEIVSKSYLIDTLYSSHSRQGGAEKHGTKNEVINEEVQDLTSER